MEKAVTNLVPLLKPGGWVQLVEPSLELRVENGPAMNEFYEFAKAMISIRGAATDYGLKLKGWLEKGGLENVQDREVLMRCGVANPDKELQTKSTMAMVSAVLGLARMSDSKDEFLLFSLFLPLMRSRGRSC